jgi:hypothetical protein
MPRTMWNTDFIEFLRVRREVRRISRDGVLKRSPADTSSKRPDRIQFSLI